MHSRPKRLIPWSAALVFIAFLPAVRYGFLDWDDRANLALNPAFSGLSWKSLWSMFTTYNFGPYQPLSSLSWALDLRLWGLSPAGFHLTNVVLHSLNAALFFLIAEELFTRSLPDRSAEGARILAFLASLFFGLHPLRVESVVWISERRDVLSGFFFLLSFQRYLAAQSPSGGGRPRLSASIAFFFLALLSKVTAVGFLWALLAVDVYPLKRLSPDPRRWLRSPERAVLAEKAPFAVLAALIGAVNLLGFRTGAVRAVSIGAAERIAVAFYGAAFYVRQTLWPAALSPYYLLPTNLRTMTGTLAAHAAAAVLATLFLWGRRRRWPAAWTAWLCYLLVLAPVSGLLQNGRQIAADRYSYLACMPLALLAAGALAPLAKRPRALWGAGLGLAGALAWLTARQIPVWRDDLSLWDQAVSTDPNNYFARSNLATVLFTRGQDAGALLQYREALRLFPDNPEALLNSGVLEERRGDLTAARRLFETALLLRPGDPEAATNLGLLLIREGRREEAEALLAGVVASRPDFASARFNLGVLRMAAGRRREGLADIREALRLEPGLAARLKTGGAPAGGTREP
jgi:tetratricopeptide (TPR) repeat protein